MQQRSKEWFEARKGRITASNFNRVMTGTATGWRGLILEIKEGSSFTGSTATEWGVKHEPEALAYFELTRNVETQEAGFYLHPDDNRIGGSPDFLLGDDEGGEIKCPYKAQNHTETRIGRRVPLQYVPQVQGCMMVTNRNKWHFMSYDPRETIPNRLVVITVVRDNEYIDKMYAKLQNFLSCLEGRNEVDSFFATKHTGATPKLF